MQSKEMTFNRNDLQLSKPEPEKLQEKLIHRIGYPSLQVVNKNIMTGIIQAIQDGLNLIQPQFLYESTPFISCKKGLLEGGNIKIRSIQWAALMKRIVKPEIIYCFAVTLGNILDNEIAQLQKKSIHHAYLLDLFGSVIAEEFADQLEVHISDLCSARGYQITRRFSPGYCDWDVGEGQKELFRFLHPESVSINCNSSGMMTPRKSISAVIIGARSIGIKSPCTFCKRKDCSGRRDGNNRSVRPVS